jgi:aspartate racemase
MGPAATVDLMQKVIDATPARNDQDHIPLIVWNVPQIPERLAAIAGDGPSPVPAMREGAIWLARAGAEAFAIACNTAHYWSAEIEDAARLPLLHIADAALSALRSRQLPPDKVMLLATTGTRRARFYDDRFRRAGCDLHLPGESDQDRISAAILSVKAGDDVRARELLFPVMTRLQAEGVDAFVLGCTEIPLIVRNSPFEAQSIDANAALAHAIVDFSLRRSHAVTDAAQHGNQMA